jgi:DNA-binding transcriptional regulator YdaS (Cro superfamily)
MTLDQWLSTPRLLPAADFARLCGASPAAVSRWRRGMMPAPHHMRAIYRVTRGAVRPNDFYDLPALSAAPTP